MRQLTQSQKSLLDKEMAKDENIFRFEDLSLDVMEKLEAINDTEILHQEATRYISDIRMKDF